MMKHIYENDAYTPGLLPANFWDTTADTGITQTNSLTDDVTTDIAIIGAGITGLNAGLELIDKDASVAIVDASHAGWGASGRNGGFVCMGGSKNSWQSLIKTHGLNPANDFYQAQIASIDAVQSNLEDLSLDVDKHSDGEWEMAHSPFAMKEMIEDANFMHKHFGLSTNQYSIEQLKELGLHSDSFYGAVHNPFGFAINPRKYVNGLCSRYIEKGGLLFGHSEVRNIELKSNKFHLHTKNGTLVAKKLIVATNGYTSDNWIPGLTGRFLPTVSNILVTRKLTPDELKRQGWLSTQMCFDSKKLLHYFRLMPNGHFLFGLRGGTSLSQENQRISQIRARHDFEKMFPHWSNVQTPWFWSGLVCLSRSLDMYVGKIPHWENAWAGLAFHGNGVAMGTWSGKQLAEMALGKKPKIPSIMCHLKQFPIHSFRMQFIKMAYSWYEAKETLESLRMKLAPDK